MSTYQFVGDFKLGYSPAVGCACLTVGRWESYIEVRRACTGAVVTFASTVLLLQRQGTVIHEGVLHHWIYCSIGSESLGCARNKLHFISIGGSAMAVMFFLVHHRKEYPPLPRQNCGCFPLGSSMCCDYYLDAAWRVGH